ncbi:HNH endonuclease [Brucella intermedia]|uniref:HNH endonuclease signature motif containing protein n=1 Tax=Brucella intermedia TaxID=94625 RepID=UPI000EFA8CCE|nr:HNH endonuclease signature motif containing protein [Brucella intermedia]MCO7736417.1 HNH endonuclease [Brucella intermedia]WLF99090.1 HNH endonuclease signature motif containing protein [Brucella intermedia]
MSKIIRRKFKPAKNETPETAIETLEYMSEWLSYSPENGLFRWKKDVNSKTKRNDIAGSVNDRGYRTICLNYKVRRAHRLAWLYVTGEWPDEDIDHINGDRDDNRIDNLRPATRTLNNANSKTRDSTQAGYKGVALNKRTGKWFARINNQGQHQHLGTFESAVEAHAAYAQAANENFGPFARAS